MYCEEDISQSCISVRCVLHSKIKNGKNVTKVRLCACSIKEIKDFPTGLPCCSRIGVWSISVLTASNRWKVQTTDVETAFLEGKQIEKMVYLWPPKEDNTNKIWRPQKCVYGLAEASRYWYLHVKEELIKLGTNLNLIDPGLFYCKKHYKLAGILACHVDDMIFKINVINNLKVS